MWKSHIAYVGFEESFSAIYVYKFDNAGLTGQDSVMVIGYSITPQIPSCIQLIENICIY